MKITNLTFNNLTNKKMKIYQLKSNDEVFFETNDIEDIENYINDNRTFGGETIELKLYKYGRFTGKLY